RASASTLRSTPRRLRQCAQLIHHYESHNPSRRQWQFWPRRCKRRVVPNVLKLNLRNLDRGELAAAVAPFGVPGDVARRLFAHVQAPGTTGIDREAVRGLSKAAAAALAAATEWPALTLLERRRAPDGFVKYLFGLPDGHAVEAVRIPLPDPAAARA